MSMSVCVPVCPRGYLWNRGQPAIFTKCFVHVAYVLGSVLLRHVDDRPHRLSAGRGDGSAQRGRSVIYDCFVLFVACLSIMPLMSVLICRGNNIKYILMLIS